MESVTSQYKWFRSAILLASVAILGMMCAHSLAQSTVQMATHDAVNDCGEGSRDGVYVRGNHLCSNGQPFIFKGVEIAGLVGPISVTPRIYVSAQQHFGEAELTAIKQFGANGIRFQIGQYGNDPKSTGYSASYVQFMTQGVNLALQDGLRVIITLQAHSADGGFTHKYGKPPLPDPDTLRVWQRLAPIWKDDLRVMYELFNEPGVDPTPSHWVLAVKGSTFAKNAPPDNPTGVVIGFQQLIDSIRETGTKNVIIVPGLGTANDLDGVIMPTDPLHNLAYGLHSPPLAGSTRSLYGSGDGVTVAASFWDREFEFLTKTAPVITTEWVATSNFRYCVPNEGAAASQLLTYSVQHDISVDGWAFDLIDSLVQNWNYKPTNYDGNVPCGTKGAGPGLLLRNYYTTGSS